MGEGVSKRPKKFRRLLWTDPYVKQIPSIPTYFKGKKDVIICGRNLIVLAIVFMGPPLAQKKAAADDITVRLRLFHWNGEGQRAFCVHHLVAKVYTK